MVAGVRIIVTTLVIGLLVVTGFMALAEVDEAKAKQVFEARCASCHNGASAPDFQGTIDKVKSWATKYANLDEAVKAEYKAFGGAESYDQLMQQMKQFSAGITDEEYQLLYNYFKQVFEASAQAGAPEQKQETPQETTTATPTPTQTPTTTIKPPEPPREAYTTPPPTVTITAWKTITPYNEEELGYTLETGLYLAVIVLVAGAALAVLARYRPDIIPSRD